MSRGGGPRERAQKGSGRTEPGIRSPDQGVCTDRKPSLKGLEDPLTQHGQQRWRARGQHGVTSGGSGILLMEGLPFL